MFLIIFAFMLMGTGSIFATPVAVHTSCGKTAYLESTDYSSAGELVEAAMAVNSALCD